jgi:hypothetical protein
MQSYSQKAAHCKSGISSAFKLAHARAVTMALIEAELPQREGIKLCQLRYPERGACHVWLLCSANAPAAKYPYINAEHTCPHPIEKMEIHSIALNNPDLMPTAAQFVQVLVIVFTPASPAPAPSHS